MKGKIMKGIAGFYYVDIGESGVYECKAKGIFRKRKIKPLVGDNVEIEIINEQEKTGNLEEIYPRNNVLVRPAVANVDQALVIFSITKPKPNCNLLDRFLIMMEQQNIKTILCFNKKDIAKDLELQNLQEIYKKCGYEMIFSSAKLEAGVEELHKVLKGKTTTVAGPSGAGKSSLINLLQPEANMETGKISEKIDRGKHTTRHSELIQIEKDTYIVDTPGFSSLYLENMEKEELKHYFPEFFPYEGRCRFQGCVHMEEPDCAVKKALADGEISEMRYRSYTGLYEELKMKRRY